MITQQQKINRPPGFGLKVEHLGDPSPPVSPNARFQRKVPDFRKAFSRSISLNDDAVYQPDDKDFLRVETEQCSQSMSAVDVVNRRLFETSKAIARSTSLASLSAEDLFHPLQKRRSSISVLRSSFESSDDSDLGERLKKDKSKSEDDDLDILDVSSQFAKCKRPVSKELRKISEESQEKPIARQYSRRSKNVDSHWDKVYPAKVIALADDLEKDCDFVCRSEEERIKMVKKSQCNAFYDENPQAIPKPICNLDVEKPRSNRCDRPGRKGSSFCGVEDSHKKYDNNASMSSKSKRYQKRGDTQRRRHNSSSGTNFQQSAASDIHKSRSQKIDLQNIPGTATDIPRSRPQGSGNQNIPGCKKSQSSSQLELLQIETQPSPAITENDSEGSLPKARRQTPPKLTTTLVGEPQIFTPPINKRVRFAETRGHRFPKQKVGKLRRGSLTFKTSSPASFRRNSSHELERQSKNANLEAIPKKSLLNMGKSQRLCESDSESTEYPDDDEDQKNLLNKDPKLEENTSLLEVIQMKLRNLFQLGPIEDVSEEEPDESQDEVMEEGCLSVRDVSDLLHAQYFILTGGRSREGWPILTFPDRGNFNYLSDEDYKRLIVYLTQLPPMAAKWLQEVDKGFVLVVDRRQDKWNAVKNVLVKVSGFFPGLIHVAYVLRPLGFLQKAISEVSNKFFREEFKFRVVVCNCVEDLHHHIDKSQLPQEMGGLIPYHHEEWMEQRLAVEKFSNNAGEISASLKRFTQLLHDTELPNDAATTQLILNKQSSEYKDIKSELSTAAQHGDTLLQCIRRSTGGPHNILNITAIERLLVQLEETETGFDGFWAKHEDRLQQCLQLRHFQEQFKDMQMTLNNRLEDLMKMPEVSESVAAVDALLQEAKQFEITIQEDCESAQKLIEQGRSLIINKHYAIDCIEPKVSELLRVTASLTEKIQRRLQILCTLRELQQRVEAAEKWCGAGVDLLSGQHLEHCATPDFAELALRDIQAFLESAPSLTSESLAHLVTPNTSPLVQQVLKRVEDLKQLCERRQINLTKVAARPPRPVQPVEPVTQQTLLLQSEIDGGYDTDVHDHKLKRVIGELLETERAYVSELGSVLTGYRNELMGPIDLNLKVDDIFGNLEQLVGFHRDTLLPRLLACQYKPAAIANTFLMQSGRLHSLYATYCQNHPSAERLLQEHGNHPVLLECQHNLGHRLPLSAYLLKPVQRVTKYQLLLKDLMKSIEDEETVRVLGDAVECMLTVLKHVNDSMRQTAITGYPNRISELGHLLLSGTFRVWMSHKKDKLRDLRLSPKTRKVFLFEKALLFCKQEGQGDQSLCHFKHCLQMSEVGLTEAVGGTGRSDGRRFEVWLPGRQEVTTLQASTPSIKEEWVKQIKQLLISQLHRLRASTASSPPVQSFGTGELSDTSEESD